MSGQLYMIEGHLEQPRRTVREAAVSYWNKAVTVRTEAHRLIARCTGSGLSDVEPHDIRESPDPFRDLAVSQSEIVDQLLAAVRS